MDDEQNTRVALQAVLATFLQEASLPDSVAFNFYEVVCRRYSELGATRKSR